MNPECRTYFERISEFLDGELDRDLCAKIESHLQDCPECRKCLESLRRTIELCRRMAEEEIDPGALERLKRAVLEALNH